MARRLTLNLCPIEVPDATLDVGVLPFESREQLRDLRHTHQSSHYFRRTQDARVLAVPLSAEIEPIGEARESVSLEDDRGLAAALIRNALLNHLHSLERKILNHDPLTFLGARPQDDLLRAITPPGQASVSWLSCRVLFELLIRSFSFDRGKPFVGLVLDVHTRKLIERSCRDFVADSFDLTGLYVGRSRTPGDPRISSYTKADGRVVRIEGTSLVLDDFRDADSIPCEEAFLEASPAAFDRCLAHVFGSKAISIRERLQDKVAAFHSGPTRLQTLTDAVNYLRGLSLELAPGVPFTVQPFLTEAASQSFPPVRSADPPVFVFDPGSTRTNTWSDGGLTTNGPYDRAVFTPTHPRVCVLCQRHRKGQVEQFLKKFLEGIRIPGGQRPYFESGFVGKYRLEAVTTEFFLVDGSDAQAYRRAAEHAIEAQTERNLRWNLAFVQIEERFHELRGEANPYLVTKAELLTHQIPSQEFEIETASQADYSLQFSLNNMALSVYAKLGGIPWLMKANPVIAHELVIGLGSASVGLGKLGDRERFVGITTVFSADGNYLLSTLSRAAPFDEYTDALLESLRDAIGKARAAMNWQPRAHIRLVFHAFKPMRNAEVDAVRRLLEGLGDYQCEYSFLHIVQDPGYVLFDELQQGVPDSSRSTKGVLAPTRGWYFRLGSHDVVLVLTGAKEVKKAADGIPRPILLRLHRDSTFIDTTYLAKQVFAFSSHSWRSFFPARLPVTVDYSHLVARLLGQLQALPRWNPNVLLGPIGRTRWFL